MFRLPVGLSSARRSVLAVALSCAALLTGSLAADPVLRGWTGADLEDVLRAARESVRPVLVLISQPDCTPCEALERSLTDDAELEPLTGPYIRMRIDLSRPEGRRAAYRLRARTAPAIILLGPAGMEASRRQRRVERTWLVEQLQMVARRHQPGRTAPAPSAQAMQAALRRLERWGDVEGTARLRERLAAMDETVKGTMLRQVVPPRLTIATTTDIDDLLDRDDDPRAIREMAFDLSRWLESEGRLKLALHTLHAVVERLGVDPLTESRAGFLAARHELFIEEIRERLMSARLSAPDSVPLLMALSRVAERSGRVFQAVRAAEAAQVYAGDNAWVMLEVHRLALLTHLSSRFNKDREPA